MKVKFLLCDEIRREIDGKLIALGVYLDDTLVMDMSRDIANPEPEASPLIGIERLTFLINTSDCNGEHFKFSAQVYDPNGNTPGLEMDLGEATIEAGTSHNVIVESKPFVFSRHGTFRFDFRTNQTTHSFPFYIHAHTGAAT